MSGRITPITPLNLTRPRLAQVSYATNTYYPIGISKDRAYVFGAYGSTVGNLAESIDDGATWTVVETFADPVYRIVETDDGEVLVETKAAGQDARLWKSSGWAASHSAATFTQVLTIPKGMAAYTFGQGSFGDDTVKAGTSKVGFIGNYGATSPYATAGWLTIDYGATWTQVHDLAARYPAIADASDLGIRYDPWWDRLWTCWQTTGTPPNGEMLINYSDDRGATWKAVPQPVGYGNTKPGDYRFSNIIPMPDCIILHNAHSGGLWRINRNGYRLMGPPQRVVKFPGAAIAQSFYKAPFNGSPLLMSAIGVGTTNDSVPYIAATYDGRTFFQAWTDPLLVNIDGAGPIEVVGPTVGGKIHSRVSQNGSTSYKHLVADLVNDPEVLSGTSTQNGTGAQTAFTIAHGLGVRPTRVDVRPGSAAAAAAYYVTWDVTNITVTFTAAPASGTGNVVLNWTAER